VNTNKKIQKSTGYFIFLLKMPRLTEIQSAQIVAVLEAGLSQSAVAIRMGINRSTVSSVFFVGIKKQILIVRDLVKVDLGNYESGRSQHCQ